MTEISPVFFVVCVCACVLCVRACVCVNGYRVATWGLSMVRVKRLKTKWADIKDDNTMLISESEGDGRAEKIKPVLAAKNALF